MLSPAHVRLFQQLGERSLADQVVNIAVTARNLAKQTGEPVEVIAAVLAGGLVAQRVAIAVETTLGPPPDPTKPFDNLPDLAREVLDALGLIPREPKTVEEKARAAGLILP